jgi:hypothetical protein
MAIKEGHPLDGEMLQGTLHLLILQTLLPGPAHGHTIARVIEQRPSRRAARVDPMAALRYE